MRLGMVMSRCVIFDPMKTSPDDPLLLDILLERRRLLGIVAFLIELALILRLEGDVLRRLLDASQRGNLRHCSSLFVLFLLRLPLLLQPCSLLLFLLLLLLLSLLLCLLIGFLLLCFLPGLPASLRTLYLRCCLMCLVMVMSRCMIFDPMETSPEDPLILDILPERRRLLLIMVFLCRRRSGLAQQHPQALHGALFQGRARHVTLLRQCVHQLRFLQELDGPGVLRR
mmetsp:Transcript_103732/g.190423  ORF Transcript_103732/g.190423 Transcript_103732/m.190423 type:complete len:227 (+) Transcript_103732:563-1243(+)